jgi:cardiolipin synthase
LPLVRLLKTPLSPTPPQNQASDWADGALARRLGQASVLGSYLDPLADKVLVCSVVGALAVQGAVPTWVAVVVIGRDVGLVTGMAAHRWRTLGWATSGVTASQFLSPHGASGDGIGGSSSLPLMRPLLISKVNTVLQLALVCGCMSHAWQGLPDTSALHYLELLTASTTISSLLAYMWEYASGRLLPVSTPTSSTKPPPSL